MSGAKAASYPNTDASEQATIAVLYGLIDHQRIKPDIKLRDKYPNTDGYIEVTAPDGVPLGKVEVQIRKIPKGATKYQCPTSLVAYSEVSTLPILLLCIDTVNQVVYWRHIHRQMPEYKPGQSSFVVHFGDSDTIDNEGRYISRWLGIIQDYQRRIGSFPVLSEKVANFLDLEGIPQDEVLYFQRYIDTLNRLLDVEFSSVKRVLYADVWKFGVGVISSDEKGVSYQIYKVPFGKPQPLLCKLSEGSFLSLEGGSEEVAQNSILRIWETQAHREPPEIRAKEFVLEKVRQVVEAKRLSIRGEMAASDVLFSFLDRYANLLGIEPDVDKISLSDFDIAFNGRLLQVCERVAKRVASVTDARGAIYLDLDIVEEQIRKDGVGEELEAEQETEGKVVFAITSKIFSIALVLEAIKYLQSKEVAIIKRPFPRRKELPWGGWIWSGYDSTEVIQHVHSILHAIVQEYKEFVEANQFRFPKSPYLDSSTSIIFEYIHDDGEHGPEIREFHVEDPACSLPKVVIAEEAQVKVDKEQHILRIYDKPYEMKMWSVGMADFFFRPLPVVHQLYRMLVADLNHHFDSPFFYEFL